MPFEAPQRAGQADAASRLIRDNLSNRSKTMQNAVPAAGEAMPAAMSPEYHEAWKRARGLAKELSRALAAAGDAEFAHIRPAGTMCPIAFGNAPQEDPLLLAIDAYKKGCADYRELPDDDPVAEEAAIEATYGAPMQVLTEWEQPARSREAVVAALELLKSEHFVAGGMGIALLDACIQFAKGEMF
ncbi:hypothetical protein ATY75_03255 [Rhizobium sp. N122]|uniref:hypothetical protein n=1 Tax=Rhizobium sp. N122 TaxID=1764272 RepID=UPI000B6835F4|nr:hypothetical protein [Rhizobium sp. N122]OWV87341.1 hypothetical protein ATY75_03255 [Rhizobium sp. N122]